MTRSTYLWATGGRTACLCLTTAAAWPDDPLLLSGCTVAGSVAIAAVSEAAAGSVAAGSFPNVFSISSRVASMSRSRSPTTYSVALAGKYHLPQNDLRDSPGQRFTCSVMPMGNLEEWKGSEEGEGGREGVRDLEGLASLLILADPP